MKITPTSKMSEIYALPKLSSCRDYLIGNGIENFTKNGDRTLVDVEVKTSGWGANDLAFGLNRLLEITSDEFLYNVYSKDEIRRDKSKKDVVLFHFPAKSENKTFALIIPGGGYRTVCSIAEGFPIAARLNELGITAFVLNYRTKKLKLFPKPMDDVAAALRFIAQNEKKFGIDSKKYLTFGFSAGGHLAGIWGSETQGYGKYGIEKPVLSVLGYPLVSMIKSFEKAPLFFRFLVSGMTVGLFGAKKKLHSFEVQEQVTENYSPCYIAQSRDDRLVSAENVILLQNALEKFGVSYKIEWQNEGGHGFGLATKNELCGWIDRAVAFSAKLSK